MKTKRPPFKIHGGKFYLAKWIIDSFPKDHQSMDYLEPYCGAASVMLNKTKGLGKEILNDVDPGIIIIHKTLRDEPELFIKKLKNITYSERVFNRELKKKEFESDLDHAINEFVIRRMSRGGMKKAFSWSDRERGGKPGDVNAWDTIIETLDETAERLQESFIFNKPAIKVINAFNYENILCYVDPPYVPDTRTSPEVYEHEMSTDDHIALAAALNNFKGKVILSGYPSTLYKRLYKEWNCENKKIANHSSQQKTKSIKVERIWKNF